VLHRDGLGVVDGGAGLLLLLATAAHRPDLLEGVVHGVLLDLGDRVVAATDTVGRQPEGDLKTGPPAAVRATS
jgi:hypothetical protein